MPSYESDRRTIKVNAMVAYLFRCWLECEPSLRITVGAGRALLNWGPDARRRVARSAGVAGRKGDRVPSPITWGKVSERLEQRIADYMAGVQAGRAA